ncbi:MAG: tetratricopeptide repeat protein [Candidatus Heimdallarchaeota archaeon]|nr:tetratricopeptide repeat protein [Candidatus Heimdallarchaeota archaeon]
MSLEPVLESVEKNLNEGNIKYALLDLKTAKGIAPDDFRVYYYYGRCYLETKEYDDAIGNLEKAYNMNPLAQISYFLALAYVRNKDWQNAVEIAEDGLTKDPSDTIKGALYYLKSGAHIELGEKKKAIAAAEKAVEVDPDNEDFKKHLELLKSKL